MMEKVQELKNMNICYAVTEEMMWALSKHTADQLHLTQFLCKTSLSDHEKHNVHFILYTTKNSFMVFRFHFTGKLNEGKVVPLHTMKAYYGKQRYNPTHS